MGYSEASIAGIKANGRRWRKTIQGLPTVSDEIEAALDANDLAAIHAGLRKVAALFAPHMTDENASFGDREALEWFQHEECTYEMEEGLMHEFRKEMACRADELYDWADYNRVWIDPSHPAPTTQERDDAKTA